MYKIQLAADNLKMLFITLYLSLSLSHSLYVCVFVLIRIFSYGSWQFHFY